MNVDAMLARYNEFKRFVLGNGLGVKRPKGRFMQKNLFMSDQVALNLFFKGQIDRLPSEYNWHPSSGINANARIVHFNGLKWNQWQDFCGAKLPADQMEKYTRLVNRDWEAYEYYSILADALSAQSAYIDQDAKRAPR